MKGADAVGPGASLSGKSQRRNGGFCCSAVTIGRILIVLGVLHTLGALLIGLAIPRAVTRKIEKSVAICAQADVEKESFLDPYGDCADCVPFYYALHLFNVTNVGDYLSTGAKLKVRELGPYVYRRRQFKVAVVLEDNGNRLSYKTYSYHTYVPEKSCTGCAETDEVVSWDTSYLSVISAAGGERAYLRRLIKGSLWGASFTGAQVEAAVITHGQKIMRWMNGLNANRPAVWKTLAPTILPFLAAGPAAIAALDVSGDAFNGVFATRTVRDWALGFPSFLAGISLGSTYLKLCKPAGGLNDKCASCVGADCLAIAASCKSCASGARVVALNDGVTCKAVEARYAAAFGATEAAKFAAGSCGLCATYGLCVAPIGGAAETSGMDYSRQAPPASSLPTTILRTGCSDLGHINEYVQYEGVQVTPFWAQLDTRRLPTLSEIAAFPAYADCADPPANLTCTHVQGGDGSSVTPLGVTLKGVATSVTQSSSNIYLSPARQNVSLVNSGESVELDGVTLTRFRNAETMLAYDERKVKKGTAVPVDGVQALSFVTGFHAFLSAPAFLFGDKSLTENVEITLFDGVIASPETMTENGKVKDAYSNRYRTFVDVEPATGKTFRAAKRLQASYALPKSLLDPTKAICDIVWPSVPAEIISPAYFGEESVVLTPTRLDKFKKIAAFMKAVLPVMITVIVVGIVVTIAGCHCRRRGVTKVHH
ncbi:hypothetical protein PINS_up009398 [Pythium insidiosum]|nr:hypothetical protein PINS_up009398 [Pythium insidiosum]